MACIRIFEAVDGTAIIRRLEADGWTLVWVTGSHRHSRKPRTVTVPHPRKDMPVGTRRNIERQSGVGLGA